MSKRLSLSDRLALAGLSSDMHHALHEYREALNAWEAGLRYVRPAFKEVARFMDAKSALNLAIARWEAEYAALRGVTEEWAQLRCAQEMSRMDVEESWVVA